MICIESHNACLCTVVITALLNMPNTQLYTLRNLLTPLIFAPNFLYRNKTCDFLNKSCNKGSSGICVLGISQVREQDDVSTSADVVSIVADGQNLGSINVRKSLSVFWVSKENDGADLGGGCRIEVAHRIVDDQAALGVATNDKLGVRAALCDVCDLGGPIQVETLS